MSVIFHPFCHSLQKPGFSLSPKLYSSHLLSLQDKSSKSCDNQLAVPPLPTDGSKSQRSKLVFEDRYEELFPLWDNPLSGTQNCCADSGLPLMHKTVGWEGHEQMWLHAQKIM